MLYVFVIMYQYLAHLAGVTVKLLRASIDIVEAHEMIQEVASFYRKERQNCDVSVSHIYVQSESMSGKVGTYAEMPRISLRQQRRSNAEAQTPREYFKRNVTIPLLDHVITSTTEQFSLRRQLPRHYSPSFQVFCS